MVIDDGVWLRRAAGVPEPKAVPGRCPCGGKLRVSGEPIRAVVREHEMLAYCELCGKKYLARKTDMGL